MLVGVHTVFLGVPTHGINNIHPPQIYFSLQVDRRGNAWHAKAYSSSSSFSSLSHTHGGWRRHVCPTNIAIMDLVSGCPDARAGVRIIVGKKTLRATKF